MLTSDRSRLALLRENRAIVALALLLCAFFALTAIARSAGLLAWDRSVTHAVQATRSPALDHLAGFLTYLGDGLPLTTCCLAGAGLLLHRRRPRAAALTVLALVSLPLNVLLKAWVGRPRPVGDLLVLTRVSGLSFPSGHAMGTMLVFGFLAFLAWVHIADRRRRLSLTATLAAMPLLIGWTRIYLGAHWFSDVIGGWTMGLFFVLLLAEVYKSIAAEELAR